MRSGGNGARGERASGTRRRALADVWVDRFLRCSKERQAAEEASLAQRIGGIVPAPLSREGLVAVRSMLSVDTPKVSGPGIRERNVQLIERLATGRRVDRPPRWQSLPRLLDEMFGWLRGFLDGGVCPLLVAAAAHHGVAVTHPFLNGNGRAARVLASAVAEAGPEPCRVNVSSAFGRHPRRYYRVVRRSLYAPGAFGEWVGFVSEGAIRTEPSETVTCLQAASCEYRWAGDEVMERYFRFLEETVSREIP